MTKFPFSSRNMRLKERNSSSHHLHHNPPKICIAWLISSHILITLNIIIITTVEFQNASTEQLAARSCDTQLLFSILDPQLLSIDARCVRFNFSLQHHFLNWRTFSCCSILQQPAFCCIFSKYRKTNCWAAFSPPFTQLLKTQIFTGIVYVIHLFHYIVWSRLMPFSSLLHFAESQPGGALSSSHKWNALSALEESCSAQGKHFKYAAAWHI